QDRADWLALSAGLAFSLSNVLLRRLQHLSESLRVFVSVAGVVLVAGVWLLLAGLDFPAVGLGVWGAAALLGGVGVVLAGLTVVYGVSRMPVHRSAIIMLFELVAGAVSSQWLTDEVVTPMEWLGGALIVLGAYFAARGAAETGIKET
ncbi:MAG TPA: DMT family transporter, partial [Gammaproteobacteria bacterium]|nr:DMT family transporter [Gammaproteobacteria bacterium]